MMMCFLPSWVCLHLQFQQPLPSSGWQASLLSKRQHGVRSELAAAGLCMIVPIYFGGSFLVLRCVVQSWIDIHSFQLVFPSLLSKCHFPFVAAFFSCQLYDTRRNTKNHSSKNIPQGSHHHPPSYPYFWWLSSPRQLWAVTSLLSCFRVGRGRDIGWEQSTACVTGQQAHRGVKVRPSQTAHLKSSGVERFLQSCTEQRWKDIGCRPF